MIDSHCHLDFAVFDSDRQQVIASARQANVHTILIPGTQITGIAKQWQLAQQFPELKLAFGLHPFFMEAHQGDALQQLEALVLEHRQHIVAIGEIGLDFFQPQDVQAQTTLFQAQLQLARHFELPVIVHHRKSHNELIRLLKHNPVPKGGVIHGFSGSLPLAQQYLDLGFYLGVGGTITYPRGAKTRETIAQLPLSTLLLETDAPDMPLSGFQGQRNSPVQIPRVAACLAELKQCTLQEVEAQTDCNFQRLFLS